MQPTERTPLSAFQAPLSSQAPASHGGAPLHDLHCHLDFMLNGEDVAAAAAQNGSLVFANTVTPAGYREARPRFADSPNVRLGLGLHPWYVGFTEARDQLGLFEELLPATPYVGEVGLDFSKRKRDTADAQLEAFERIADACGKAGGKLLSIHAVKSADRVLDILQDACVLEACTCIFHWFSGSTDQLHRAIKAGCFFSVGPFMAESRRGREYLKVIPLGQLVMETDAPPTRGDGATTDPVTGEPRCVCPYAQLNDWLERSAAVISKVKGEGAFATIDRTARELLSR